MSMLNQLSMRKKLNLKIYSQKTMKMRTTTVRNSRTTTSMTQSLTISMRFYT